MRKVITGDQVAQIRNPDPFAFPIWRAPVYRTLGWIVAIAQLGRFIGWLVRLIVRHPVVSLVLAVFGFTWSETGWLGVTLLVVWATVVLVCWRVAWPISFARRVATPARSQWRAGRYRRRWASVMTISGLAPWYQGRIILPVLGKVRSTVYVDRVQVRLVSGQSAAQVADVADNLAHGFGAILCRVRTARSGAVLLEFVRRDALAQVVPPAPIRPYPDLRALQVGRRENGCRGWSSCTAPTS
jgi:DNA segregation ATPase FtsK/SpoIIIE, S-DNA-T family